MVSFVWAMLFGLTESVSIPMSMSFEIASVWAASSPQILTGLVAFLTIILDDFLI